MAETIELATILVTDLVGSTRLASSVGPVRADELRDEHFDVLREAIRAWDGHEFRSTGDGMMVAFKSASAAVHCAVSMQQLIERRYRRAEPKLQVRIGLGAGESTVQNGEYFGMPSIEAARFCDQAGAEGILASPAVRLLAARLEGIGFESVGPLELKGFPEPVDAFAVPWTRLADETAGVGGWPLPPLLRSTPQAAFVGRDEERLLIERSRNAVSAGAQRVVLVSGEPGIGKSRLASLSAYGAHGEGFAVLWGACFEELAVPYEPWIAVCSQLVAHAPIEVLERHVARHGGELARLARDLPRRLPGVPEPESSDPETERFLLFSAVSGALVELAASVPICLVLDDLHWADAQSVALVKHVTASAASGALQVILAFRDSDLGPDHPLNPVLQDLRRIEGVERIALEGFGATEVSEVMAAAAGHELDADGLTLAAEIASETDGNPFFVGEVLRSLVESGRIQYDSATERWSIDRTTPLGLPESVRDVIARRVERLGDETHDVLTLAAVIGRSFDLALLARLVETPESELLERLEATVAASLLDESHEEIGRFGFAHALINQTLYDGVGATRRAEMHHRVAVALEELYGQDRVAELALHWRLSSRDKSKAARYSALAGRQALDSLAPADGARLFAHALDLLGEDDDAARCEALIGLGEAQQLIGDPAYRATLLHAARIASSLGDARLAAAAALANTRGFTSLIGDLDDEREEAIERALELDDGADLGRRAQLLALQSQELLYEHDPTRRQALALEAIALARDIGDPRVRARVLQHAFHGLWSPDKVAVRAEVSRDLLASAQAAEDRALESWANLLLLHCAIETGDFARGHACSDRLLELATALQQPTLSWVAQMEAAAMTVAEGNLIAGEEIARKALAIGELAGQPDALRIFGEFRALARLYQGRGNAELIELSRHATSMFPRMAVWPASTAVYEAYFGDKESARTLLGDAVASGLSHVGWDTLRLVALSFYADAASRLRAADAAELIHELMSPWDDQVIWGGAQAYGHVRLWLAVAAAAMGRHDEADDAFAFACRFHDDNGLMLWAARSHLGWAESLADRGESAQAQPRAARALELAQANGYGLIEALAAPIARGDRVAND
ncbi:MAG TPA: AAA family ATPase [Gaiellaceae bacterium]|jgi:class 3 adenylate cyclase